MTLFCTTFSIVMTVSSVRNASYYYLKSSLIVVGRLTGWWYKLSEMSFLGFTSSS